MRVLGKVLIAALPVVAASNMILRDEFGGTALDSSWKAGKGKWEMVGGAVKGSELASDKHAAVIRRPVAYRNADIVFEFKLAGAEWVALSLNKQGAHVARVVISPKGFRIQKDSPTAMLAKNDDPIAADVWHKMRVTVDGQNMKASLDARTLIEGRHEAIDVDKVDIGFPVKGQSVYLRNVSVTTK